MATVTKTFRIAMKVSSTNMTTENIKVALEGALDELKQHAQEMVEFILDEAPSENGYAPDFEIEILD